MATPPEPKREGFIPRTPKVQSTTDYIVLVFVILVATILLGISFAALYAFLFTDKDVGPFIAIITDLMTTIIAALVGYMAGKNAGKNGNGVKP
jgi:hypothetical protein